jgi:hypothetical protein
VSVLRRAADPVGAGPDGQNYGTENDSGELCRRRNRPASEPLETARARADHLAIAASAMAVGLLEPNGRTLSAIAQLAAALALDLGAAA